MASVRLFDQRRLGRVPTRVAALSRLVPDVLAVLPKAWPQRAAGHACSDVVAAPRRNGTRSQGFTCGSGLSQDLAAN